MEYVNAVSNPPYNMKWNQPLFAQLQPRFSHCDIPPESNANMAFVLTAFDEVTGKAVFILPNGILNNDIEKPIIKYLVDKNFVEAVIVNPGNMFESTNIGTCILVLNKCKSTSYIELVDMRNKYETEVRDQNGQVGGSSHTKRTYHKEINVYSDAQIEETIDCIKQLKNIPGYSKAVTTEDVKANNYILVPSRYIEFQEIENKHREYKDIVSDLNRVIDDRNTLKLTMNETIAKALGISEIYEFEKQSKETLDGMNKITVLIGTDKIHKSNYISLSKNKNEIKFENNSKNKVSEILMMIFSQWKTHIYYLNQEENRYLVELRDAVLPELMSGRIQLDDKGSGENDI